jgi:hypothetical protein
MRQRGEETYLSRRRVVSERARVCPRGVAPPRTGAIRYAWFSARAPQTRGHDGAPPSAPECPCPPTSRARHPRRSCPRSGQAVRAASEHVDHAGARSRNASAQRSCAEALHRCAHASACAEGCRGWRIGEGRGDTGRTYILRRREVYSVCARPRSWNARPSARWSCASTNCAIQSAPDALRG